MYGPLLWVFVYPNMMCVFTCFLLYDKMDGFAIAQGVFRGNHFRAGWQLIIIILAFPNCLSVFLFLMRNLAQQHRRFQNPHRFQLVFA